jgi:hypothetical protein
MDSEHGDADPRREVLGAHKGAWAQRHERHAARFEVVLDQLLTPEMRLPGSLVAGQDAGEHETTQTGPARRVHQVPVAPVVDGGQRVPFAPGEGIRATVVTSARTPSSAGSSEAGSTRSPRTTSTPWAVRRVASLPRVRALAPRRFGSRVRAPPVRRASPCRPRPAPRAASSGQPSPLCCSSSVASLSVTPTVRSSAPRTIARSICPSAAASRASNRSSIPRTGRPAAATIRSP